MANSLSARKRARQAERHRMRNAALRSHVRTAIKKVEKNVDAGDKTAAEAAFKSAVPAIDRSVAKGVMRKNTAARYKSRLNRRVNDLN